MSNPLCLTEMRWRSISNKAIQSEVQLAGTCAYEVATHFSRCCSIWESVNLVALAFFHGGTPILIQTWFSHLNAYASTCALHPNEYPNLAGRWRSLSSSVATHFSRCCSICEIANLVAVDLVHGGTPSAPPAVAVD